MPRADLHASLAGLLTQGTAEAPASVLFPFDLTFLTRVAVLALGKDAVVDTMTAMAAAADQAVGAEPPPEPLAPWIDAAFRRAEQTPVPLLRALVTAATTKRWRAAARRRAALAVAAAAVHWLFRLGKAKHLDQVAVMPGADGNALMDALRQLEVVRWRDPVWRKALPAIRKTLDGTRDGPAYQLVASFSTPNELALGSMFEEWTAALVALETEALELERQRLTRLEAVALPLARAVFGRVDVLLDEQPVMRGKGRARTARLLADAVRLPEVRERAAVALAALVVLDDLERALRNERRRRIPRLVTALRHAVHSKMPGPVRQFLEGVLDGRWREAGATPDRCRVLESEFVAALGAVRAPERPCVTILAQKTGKLFRVRIVGGKSSSAELRPSLADAAVALKQGLKPSDPNAKGRLNEWLAAQGLPQYEEVDFLDLR